MELVITPLVSVGKIEFGMKRQEVRAILGEYKEFKKNKFSKNTTDSFDFCHVYYDEHNKCNFVEIFNKKSIILILNDKKLFDMTLTQFSEYLKFLDKETIVENEGATSHKLSIASWSEAYEDNKIEVISFGQEKYYT